MGQLSPSYNYALIFSNITSLFQSGNDQQSSVWKRIGRISMALMLIALLCLPAQASATALELPESCETGYEWHATVYFNCPLGDGSSVFHESFYYGAAGFSGFSDNLTIHANAQGVTLTLSGPTSTMPPYAEIAIITVTDPDCSGATQYVVHTDGSGTVLILDML